MHLHAKKGPHIPQSPFHWANSQGLELRLQVFVAVKNDAGEIALVREKAEPDAWRVPGETLRPNEDVNDAAKRVTNLWFERDLDARVTDVLTWPDDGAGKWYIIFLYEARADLADLGTPEDTEEIRFVKPGEALGRFGMSHADIWERLS